MDKNVKEAVSKGGIYVRAILEVVGKPKKYVEETLDAQIKRVKENFKVIKEKIEKPEEQENFFSTFVELEVLVKDEMDLLIFCFDYMPSSVEVIEPEKIVFKNNVLSGFLNDLQGRLHALNTGIMQIKDTNVRFVKNTAVLLRNFIVVLCAMRPMKIQEMVEFMGVDKENVEKILEVLVKEGKIKKEGDLYKAVKNDRLQKSD
ncbi:MAG: hypothetical protein NDI94_00325 [Candidatus Woesearchaeota archaeon]|nr:hypothetical protein [Candidatus Woesearchaeota archaeon]